MYPSMDHVKLCTGNVFDFRLLVGWLDGGIFGVGNKGWGGLGAWLRVYTFPCKVDLSKDPWI